MAKPRAPSRAETPSASSGSVTEVSAGGRWDNAIPSTGRVLCHLNNRGSWTVVRGTAGGNLLSSSRGKRNSAWPSRRRPGPEQVCRTCLSWVTVPPIGSTRKELATGRAGSFERMMVGAILTRRAGVGHSAVGGTARFAPRASLKDTGLIA